MEELKPAYDQEKETAEEKMVNDAFQELLNSYISSPHRKKLDIITKAFNFAKKAHQGVRRLSGEPYIMHPISVAMIASKEMGLGSTSICCALLHDVVEDTDYTVDDIANIFGEKIAQIVDGLTKISGGIFGDQASAQAENFKKLLLTMSTDIRVILIKICDRLHNMRTLSSQPANKQYKIAGETIYLYAPIANRLGLNKIKNELEDLSFRYEHPDTYADIKRKLAKKSKSLDELFENFTKPIREKLDEMGINYIIKGRVKSPYSIWTKMQKKHVTFDEIYDILAVRIIFTPQNPKKEKDECFSIYLALQELYTAHPDRFRDWVSTPKANGYQALHLTLMSTLKSEENLPNTNDNEAQWVEVQIRSERMNEIAEQGFAAHWKYKDKNKEGQTADEQDNNADDDEDLQEGSELNGWLRTIKEILDDPQPDAMDFLDAIKLNLFASEIFVFTPKGEIKRLPLGCTVLDFAFSIHTFLGSHCIGAKVNHKLVPLSHRLSSGDQVQILTSNSQHVEPNWLEFATTAKAKAKIEAVLRKYGREKQKNGEDILTAFLEKNGLQMTTSVMDKLCAFHDMAKHDMLLEAIGERRILLSDKDIEMLLQKKGGGWRKYVPFLSSGDSKKKDQEGQKGQNDPNGLITVDKSFNRKKPIFITENNIHRYIFPVCCHAIPGDDTLGFIDNKNHIEIHKRDCPVATKLKSSYGNRIIDAKWDMHKVMLFDASIQIRGIDRIGLLNEVTQVLSRQMSVNLRKVVISSNDGIFDGTIDMRVHDREDVKAIIINLKTIQGLQEILQIR
ncbi:MAG: bifunctional (p)ppGpp synthetase/guanosine-3',5'-bis(diphosphate) 3'-pyrophosphohydrolase [Prevotella sp.]|nr:bifunctional (p)ppGpp synthetase/guanosine-3',5'-bis(diphosphate) 3'-pyrophosphohydrolase [Prevotella sp.]